MTLPLGVGALTVVLAAIAILSVVVLVLIIVAPWKGVRSEPPLDKDVEARLLLHRENPEQPTGELPATVTDLTGRETEEHEVGDYTDLSDLDTDERT